MKFGIFLIFTILLSPRVRAEEDNIIRPYLSRMHRQGQTQKQISEQIHVSPSKIGRYLSGATQSSPTIIHNFKNAFPDQFIVMRAQHELNQEIFSISTTLLVKPSDVLKKHLSYVGDHDLSIVPITIANRIEGQGKAAFYDHQMIRAATGMMTQSIYAPHHVTQHLETYAKQLPFDMHLSGQTPPSLSASPEGPFANFLQETSNMGLLVIAGRASKYENRSEQNHFEQALIRQAMLRGQPILAICAGCWQLWEYSPMQAQEDKKRRKGKRVRVTGHAASRMVHMSENNGRAVYNMQVHGVRLTQDSLLQRILPNGPDTLRVNSVHGHAPDPEYIPEFFQVSATSIHDKDLSPANRHGLMNVEEDTIEAFETKFGAPVVGIQWHPEAYNKGSNTEGVEAPEHHREIIKYMAQAGVAYSNKRKMLAELDDIFSKI